jgi:hypothetical protein
MQARHRRKLDMGDRVRGFNAAHPSPDPAWVGLAQQLDERCARAAELAEVQAGRAAEARASTAHHMKLRRRLRTGLVRVLVKAGQTAAKTDPSLEQRFRPVRGGAASREFITAVRALVTAAREHGDALASHGAPPELIDRAAALLDQYVTATREGLTALNARVEAGAALKEVTAEVVGLVGRLDALNRDRFLDEPELLTAWASARNVLGPFRSQNGNGNGNGTGSPDAGITPEPTPPSGTDGDVQASA